ncbi:MAG: hypothetical protein DDG60_11745 [Anaerolineae bacterium]|nr:MAG: hypothetical protein DDG60_11745 [Anaerolineae bacterium]
MRILMVGPGIGVVGGINALVDVLVPALEKKVSLSYCYTVKNRHLKKSGRLSVQNLLLAISQYTRFLLMFLKTRPHIVHIHTSQGLAWLKDTFYILLSKLLGAKVVLHIHAADFNDLYDQKNRALQQYTRWVMGLSDMVISVSETWKQRLQGIIPGDKICALPNCINVKAFPDYATEEIHQVQAMFIGSIGLRKGAFDLIEALGRLKLAGHVLPTCIAGYEESEGLLEKARARVQELGLNEMCRLPGTVQGQEKKELFAQSHLFILPSYNEGLPMAILEGMAAGMAIVSTPVGGIPEVVHDGYNGFLVPPGDVRALAEKLIFLATNPHLCRLMGTRSREIVETLDVTPYVERLMAVYRTLHVNGRLTA